MVQTGDAACAKVCVFGSGTFGTALGTVIARNGHAVSLLTRRDEVAQSINTKHINPQHLSDCKLPPLLSATTSPAEALKGVSFIVHCIPVQSTAGFLEPLKDIIPQDVPIISTSKGLHSETLETMAELVPRVLGRKQPMAFLSGPTFAKELMDANPSAAVMASDDSAVADACARIFHSDGLRCYTTSDVIGVEVGGALKNVYALAAGALEGMGLGVNPTAFLVTRACTEMNILAVAMGARSYTMQGLAGIGDLMLTCMGGASRNKAVGARLGKGETLKSILDSRKSSLEGVAEGVATAPAAIKLAKRYGVEAPIAEAVGAVLDGKAKPQQAILSLMQRPRREDFAKVPHKIENKMKSPLGVHPKIWAAIVIGEATLLLALAVKAVRNRS
eukprot:TRINITY_DN26835_c0_g2_i1.p1 TRINITY_DN26835_c0_g2~~TRINITY_DN26835_c0_g2_i1.p1  ORF type:complete len:389 (+),score=60.67 TRINITY_DN26835_c0_g2_i1:71-1237(+)